MTHKQKPDGAEFRTLETQVSECARDLRASLIALEEKLYVEFAEAADRGAAEQRRKYAEGAEAVQAPDEGPFLIVFQEDGVKPELFAGSGAKKGAYERFEMVSAGYHCRLYAAVASSMKHDRDNGALLRIANVAALEARVVELEAEKHANEVAAFERGFQGGRRDRYKQYERDAAEAVAAERERCARIVEDHCEVMGGPNGRELGPRSEGDRVALCYVAAIREGGEHG